MATTTPGHLQERLVADVDEAFPAVVERYIDGLYSGVLRLTNERTAAEDIVQETFVRAHGALHRYTPQRRNELRVSGWLWTIALNLCRNRARDVKRRPKNVPLDSVAESAATDDPATEAIAAVDTTWSKRLRSLADHERTAVVLRHVVGLSYRDMSTALDRPEGTLKSDVHRGLKRLRILIEDEGTNAA